MLRRTTVLMGAFVVASLLIAVGGSTVEAQSPLITVTTDGDQPDADPNDSVCRTAGGGCSLRAAITHANLTRGPNTIEFAIPGAGIHTIALASPLPTINDGTGPTTIDGYSQPGAVENTAATGSNAGLLIEVVGPADGTMLRIASEANVVRGLSTYGATIQFLIEGVAADGNRLLGNFIGTSASGTYENPIVVDGGDTGVGVLLQLGASQNVIGAPGSANRNIISGNGGYGMRINHGESHENLVQNNVVGLNPLLTDRLRQWHGIDLQWWTWGNLIGGYDDGESNLVGGQIFRGGIELSHGAQDNLVIGNLVGTMGDGNTVSAFSGNTYGITLKDFPRGNYIANNVIGGNDYGIWSKHNYNGFNTFVENRVGVGRDGGVIPNDTNVFFTGTDHVWYENIVANQPTAQFEINDYLANEAAFYYATYTHANRISQGQYYSADAGAGGQNVAIDGVASQSSVDFGGGPERAIDGNTSGVYGNGSITHTANEANAWWQVDLGADVAISEITLHNRTDCCTDRLSNFSVFVSETSLDGRSYGDIAGDPSVWQRQVDTLSSASEVIPVGVSGRYVRVQLQGSNYLSLAEVEVHTESAALAARPPIDIDPDGLNGNDVGDGDSGIQDLLNWPVVVGVGPGKVFGSACPGCMVEIYVSGSLRNDGTIDTSGVDHGLGLAWIGTVVADGSGAFSMADARIVAGRAISALAIDQQGNTSELPPGEIVPVAHRGVDGVAGSSLGPSPAPAPLPLPRRFDYPLDAGVGGRVVDLSGDGVSDVGVDLFNSDRSAWLLSTSSAADGSFSVAVDAGCYVVTFIAPAGTEFASGAYLDRSVCVEDGESVSDIVAELLVNGDGQAGIEARVVDSAGGGVADVSIDLYESDGAGNRQSYLRSTATDGSGSYSFTIGSGGCYVVTFIAPTGQTFVESGTAWFNREVCLDAGQVSDDTTATVDTDESPSSVLSGTIADGAGQVAGIVIDLFTANADGSRGSYLSTAISDADGSFILDTVAGCYVLTYLAPADRTWVTTGTAWRNRPVCVEDGQAISDLDATLT